MRNPKEDEKVTCQMDHHGGAGADLTPTGCWDSTTPEGRRITYGVIPEHQFEGKPCEYTGQVVEVKIAGLESNVPMYMTDEFRYDPEMMVWKGKGLTVTRERMEDMQQMELFKSEPQKNEPQKNEPEVAMSGLLVLLRELDTIVEKLLIMYQRSIQEALSHK